MENREDGGYNEKGEDAETTKMKESLKTTFGVSRDIRCQASRMTLLSYFAFTKVLSSKWLLWTFVYLTKQISDDVPS